MIAVIDASVLLFLFDPDCGAPLGPDGAPVEACKERVDYLVDRLSKNGGRIIVPAPALAEVLVNAGDAGPEWLGRLSGKRAIRVEPFDEMAAIECAALARDRARRGSNAPRAKSKFDEQIVAIAKVHGATEIYSDDADIRKLVNADIIVSGIADLPLPPEEAQRSLALAQPPEERE